MNPPLRPLHPDSSDGTMLDGHHRIKILRGRGVDIHALPRETIHKMNL